MRYHPARQMERPAASPGLECITFARSLWVAPSQGLPCHAILGVMRSGRGRRCRSTSSAGLTVGALLLAVEEKRNRSVVLEDSREDGRFPRVTWHPSTHTVC